MEPTYQDIIARWAQHQTKHQDEVHHHKKDEVIALINNDSHAAEISRRAACAEGSLAHFCEMVRFDMERLAEGFTSRIYNLSAELRQHRESQKDWSNLLPQMDGSEHLVRLVNIHIAEEMQFVCLCKDAIKDMAAISEMCEVVAEEQQGIAAFIEQQADANRFLSRFQ